MVLLKKQVTLVLLLVLALSAFAALPSVAPTSSASAQQARSLSLTGLPPSLPTSSSGASSFPALVVTVIDSQGNPVVSPNATTVYLSSSESAVLSVQSTVVIPAGAQYAIADVYTTATPGNSTVTAVAPGFNSASTEFETSIARGYPTQLRFFPLPGSFPSGFSISASYAVAVVDAAGLPARTVQATPINVTSSDTGVVTVGPATIPLNQTIGYGILTTVGPAGTAAITASASGLVSSTVPVTVDSNYAAPVLLSLNPPPTSLPANGATYNVLTLSLFDNQSRPSTAQSLVQVVLSSSRPDIASVPDSVTVNPGVSFVRIPVTTSSSSGVSVITASAPNFISSSAIVTAVSIPPTQLGIYLAANNALISKNSNQLNLVVQLQDSNGVPAEARSPANVLISFSNSTLLQAPISLTIPKGSDLAYADVPLPQATKGTFSAISNGLYPAFAKFDAAPLAVTDSFLANPPAVPLGQTVSIVFTLKSQGNPVDGALLTWKSNGGTVSASKSATDATGSWTAAFTPTAMGLATVTVTASSPVMGVVNSTVYVTVQAAQAKQSQSLAQQLLSFPYVLILIGAAAVVAVVAFLFVRRRRRSKEADSALSEDEQGFSYLHWKSFLPVLHLARFPKALP